MSPYEKLLLQNKSWVKDRLDLDPDYFKKLAKIQNPDFLWIGCSDSRVPANQITGTEPGEVFVHRNIANVVVLTDLNMLSVLSYAVEQLKVKHVVVCGHYGCGGVKAAISRGDFGLLNKWLTNIKDVYRLHADEINKIEDEQQKEDRLIELNVIEQVRNLKKTNIIQKAWKKDQLPTLHGWVYGLKDGILKDLCKILPGDDIDPIFSFKDV